MGLFEYLCPSCGGVTSPILTQSTKTHKCRHCDGTAKIMVSAHAKTAINWQV